MLFTLSTFFAMFFLHKCILCNFRTHLKSDGWMFISWTRICGVQTGADRDQTTNLPNSRWPFFATWVTATPAIWKVRCTWEISSAHLSAPPGWCVRSLLDFGWLSDTAHQLQIVFATFYFVLHFSSFLNFFMNTLHTTPRYNTFSAKLVLWK